MTFHTEVTCRNETDAFWIDAECLSIRPEHHFRLLRFSLDNWRGIVITARIDFGDGVLEAVRLADSVVLPRGWLLRSEWMMAQPSTPLIQLAVHRDEEARREEEVILASLTVQMWRQGTQNEE